MNDHPPAQPRHPGDTRGGARRTVLDAEVISPDGRQSGDGGFAGSDNSARYGAFTGPAFFGVWHTSRANSGACLGACVSFALFFVCLAQYGFLAGLGFAFFLAIGAVAGSLREMRMLMRGRQPDPWVWRIGVWCAAFLLTIWLAGGFD